VGRRLGLSERVVKCSALWPVKGSSQVSCGPKKRSQILWIFSPRRGIRPSDDFVFRACSLLPDVPCDASSPPWRGEWLPAMALPRVWPHLFHADWDGDVGCPSPEFSFRLE